MKKPSEIIAEIAPSTATNRIVAELHKEAVFRVIARRNALKNGFAVCVEHDGKEYAVQGYRTKPSIADLAETVQRAIDYGNRFFVQGSTVSDPNAQPATAS